MKNIFSDKTTEKMESREKLQLTTQMWSELGRIDARIHALPETVYRPIITRRLTRREVEREVLTATAELNTLKEVLENMLLETDIKAKSSLLVAS